MNGDTHLRGEPGDLVSESIYRLRYLRGSAHCKRKSSKLAEG
jgi:hypothetical protein